MHPLFEREIQGKIGRQAKGSGRRARQDLLLIIHHVKRQTVPRLNRVNRVESMDHWQFEEWNHAPSHESIGNVPWIRPRQLRAQQRDIQAEIEYLVRMDAGARVGAVDGIAITEIVPQTNREGVVAVVAPVPEDKVTVHRPVESVVGEAVNTTLFDE